jgi:hypothetical protein
MIIVGNYYELDECCGIQILNPSNPTLGIHFSLNF